jgi:transcriptional regulator with XRE-family HTH domain
MSAWPLPDPERHRRAEHALAMVRVGEEIRRLREMAGLTLCGLSHKMKLSAPFWSDVEHGRRALTADRLAQVAPILGTTLKALADVAGVCTHCMGSGYAPVKKRKETAG